MLGSAHTLTIGSKEPVVRSPEDSTMTASAHAATQPQLPLARYHFDFQACDALRLPPDPGGLWHGVFGARLRELSCVMPPGTDCRGCMLLHHCAYSLLFSGPRPPTAELMRRYETIPVPHVFQLDPDTRAVIPPGGPLRVGMVLAGTANAKLPFVVQAMAAAGRVGLGATRARLRLREVVQEGADGSSHRVAEPARMSTPLPPGVPDIPPVPVAARIHFITPYKAGAVAGQAGAFDPGSFLMAIVRRCSLLQYFYTGRQLEAPFTALKEASQQARILGQALRARAASRYAARHGRRVPTGGLIGHVDLDLRGLEAFWPYLYLGQWLNVGKNASMGFGRYVLTAHHDTAPPSG